MKLSKEGAMLIQSFEDLRLTAYKPVATETYYTIGWGHYGADVKKDMVINRAKAEELFRQDVRPIEKELNAMGINFTQNQFDVLVSWCFNLGVGAFKGSTMCRYIKEGRNDLEITDQLVKWVNSAGRPLLGLKKRRIEEANMWINPLGYMYYLNKDNKITRMRL